MQHQLRRLRLLVRASRDDKDGRIAVTELVMDLLAALCEPRPIRAFIREKVELLAYLAVGHAAQQGAKYVVQSRTEYAGFLRKSFLGGAIVAVFACLKIHLSHEAIPPLPQALVYGLNYAVCFVLIYLFGATLATKQPALTASRLARALEDGKEHEDFALLVRSIWQSQFISFVGNICGAALVAGAIAWLFHVAFGFDLVSEGEALKLASKHAPFASGALWYAAIAGVFLSSAGFLAGFVDNAVVFHRVGERVAAGTGVFRHLSATSRTKLAGTVGHAFGAVSGNVVLGFMLGSAGAIGAMLGLPIDIRHIAFSSSHTTLAVIHADGLQTAGHIATLLAAVLLIGIINFLVSFGMTLWVAIAARDIEGIDWRAQLRSLGRLIRSHPAQFFIPLRSQSSDE
ncbi:MAG: site-specific recombinase [Myxococcota bacterium]|jgi:site-specific recombinase